MLAGFLFKAKSLSYADAFLYIGIAVAVIGVLVTFIPFKVAAETEEEDNLAVEKLKLQSV